jgi:Ca2+-binding EF-hand superfamily protein
MTSAEERDNLSKVFQELDKNNDGSLSEAELIEGTFSKLIKDIQGT